MTKQPITDWPITRSAGVSPLLGHTHRQSYKPKVEGPTEKQVSFMRSLAQQVANTLPSKHSGIPEVVEIELGQEMTKRRASAFIDRLLVLREEAKQEAARATRPKAKGTGLDLSKLTGGYYAVRTEDGVKFFKVDVVREDGNKWDGWVFVRAQASDDLYRIGSQRPGETYMGKAADALAEIVKDEQAAFALYGHELGKCGVCGRTLTDEESRARGIGPVCAAKVGF